MKRESAAVALLLMLLGTSIGNLAYFDDLTDQIEAELKLSRQAVAAGDYPSALEAYRRAESRWLDAEPFTGVFIRHPEADSTADAFFELKQELCEENSARCAAAFDKLFYHLDRIDQMEHPRLGSIF